MLNIYVMAADTIQANKKFFINLYITNPELRAAWNEYVDDQTDFIHRALSTGHRVSSAVRREVEKYFFDNWVFETAQSNKQSQ